MSETLYGYRFSPTVEEVLHVIALTGANVTLDNVCWKDIAKSTSLAPQTPTRTFPFLKTKQGNISEVKAINYYLAETYKPILLGKNDFEKAQVHQWIEFAEEFNALAEELVYPILGWRPYCHERAALCEEKLNQFLLALDAQVKGHKYVMGDSITLADVALFRALKLFFQLVLPENKRKNLYANADDWFRRVYNTPEVDCVYGEFTLCKVPLKVHCEQPQKKECKKQNNECKKQEGEKKQKEAPKQTPKEDGDGEEPKEKKSKNPLDSLPPTTFELETFKRAFLNNKDSKDAVQKFFNEYDPNGYSIYFLEYDNLPTECKVLIRTNNAMSFFVQKCNPAARYLFGNLGVYGDEGDYKIRGVWFFRGKGVPDILKDNNDTIEYYNKRELDLKKKEDRELVEEYWTKRNEGVDVVDGRKLNTFTFVH